MWTFLFTACSRILYADTQCRYEKKRKARKERKTNSMMPKACFTRRIGSTNYRVNIFCTGNETMEQKILHLVRENGMDISPERGIMTMPQMSREPERRIA